MSLIPYFLSLRNKISCCYKYRMLSWGHKRSVLRDSVILLRKWTMGCEVECSERKPNCHLLSIVDCWIQKWMAVSRPQSSQGFLKKNLGEKLVGNCPYWSRFKNRYNFCNFELNRNNAAGKGKFKNVKEGIDKWRCCLFEKICRDATKIWSFFYPWKVWWPQEFRV